MIVPIPTHQQYRILILYIGLANQVGKKIKVKCDVNSGKEQIALFYAIGHKKFGIKLW